MTRSEEALRIFEREYDRLFRWANQRVDEWSARSAVYAGFAELMWAGVGGRHTQSGATAALYRAAEPFVRRSLESKGSYLPVNAWKHAPWPSYAHALELSELFTAWVYAHKATELGWEHRLGIVGAVRAYHPGRLLLPTGTRSATVDAVIEKSLRLVAAALDDSGPRDPAAAALAREVWQRERYRTALWYRSRGITLGGAVDGEEQQDHDPGLTGSPDRDDQLAGLWGVRQPEPLD